MKRRIYLTVIIGLMTFTGLFAQTSGTLTFTFTTTPHSGSYGSKHVVAVWIEDANGTFVKTSLRMAATSHTINHHLMVWKSCSGMNTTDAITGATLTSYADSISITWNGTDVNEAVVADGTYSVWVEESWDEGTLGTSTTSVEFTKGNAVVNLTPADTPNFTNMSLSWAPGTASAVNEKTDYNNAISVYPNPSKGIVNLKFSNLVNVSTIKVVNSAGSKVLENKIDKALFGTKKMDLSKLPAGVYFIKVGYADSRNSFTQKVVLKK